MRLYIRLPNWVGDVVMATPLLDALHHALPHLAVTLGARAFLNDLLEPRGRFDDFLPAPPRGLRPLLAHGRQLESRHFDAALLLADSVRTALPPWLAHIPVRAGYARDPLRRALLTHHLPPPTGPDGRRLPVPMTERYLALMPLLGVPRPEHTPKVRLEVHDPARAAVAARLQQEGVGTSPYLVASPGASFGASKLYPPDQFASALDGIIEATGLVVILAPGPGEEALCRSIAGAMARPAVVLADPVTSLGQLAALISAAAIVVGNDTGPRHMALGLGVPVVTLMGPTDPRHSAYQLERQVVLREDVDCSPHPSPCHLKTCPIDQRCMTRIAPERVVAAVRELMSSPVPPTRSNEA